MTEPSLPRHGPSSEASLAREEPNSHVDDPSAGAQRLLEDTDSSGKKAVSENIEGKVENKQKRKRTSAHDQAILEAEYKRNSKPNKITRAEIVRLVALNEKEVQIWFQNRRQIDRRKSRPLLPHEVAALGIGGVPYSSDPAVDATASSFSIVGEAIQSSQKSPESSQEKSEPEEQFPPSAPFNTQKPNLGIQTDDIKSPTKGNIDMAKVLARDIEVPSQLKSTQSPLNASSVSDGVIQSFTSTPGYLANRWNSLSNWNFTPPASQGTPFTPQISQDATHPSSCPERIGGERPITPPSSQVRLSMSLEGKAELVSTLLSPIPFKSGRPGSPGPPLPQKRARGLQRSMSALPFGSTPRTGPNVPRLLSGRSRDARTWELCCDTEARDELTKQAENESSGSAVAAISLLRSSSNSALKPNSQKRNIPPKSQSTGWTKRQKLERAHSSLARLEASETLPLKISQSKFDNGKDGNGGLPRSPSGDSDKENRIPFEGGGNPRRRPLPSSRTDKHGNSKRVLEENLSAQAPAVGFGIDKKRRQVSHKETVVFEDGENADVPEDVERFMRGEISPSKKGDLDCVQGLLSLSQGNWR